MEDKIQKINIDCGELDSTDLHIYTHSFYGSSLMRMWIGWRWSMKCFSFYASIKKEIMKKKEEDSILTVSLALGISLHLFHSHYLFT